MKVHKQETEAGQLELITFRPDENETSGAFRQSVTAKYPMTWEQFVNRLVIWESNRIVIDMR